MIKFNCKICGQKLNVPGARAGKKGKCPRCKNIVVVPEIQHTDSVINQKDSGIPEFRTQNFADNEILLEAIEKDKTQDELFGFSKGPEKDTEYEQEPEEEPSDDTELPPERKLPWLIDVFLYPICTPGLITLGIIIIIPLLINIFVGLLGPFGILALPFSMLINFVISCTSYGTLPNVFVTVQKAGFGHQKLLLMPRVWVSC
jgi:phage FluMu protein Com